MTLVPGWIHASITALKVSAVLSGTGMRNVLTDSRSTPPNTHCPITVAFIIFAPTELALVDLDSLVRTADHLTAALHVHQHGLSAELAPFRVRVWTEAMLLLDKAGRDAAHDVCENHNLLEIEVTMLRP
jgi:hypothetical protein